MLTKDMVAGTEYATCDGKMVVPVEPVHSQWGLYWVTSKKREDSKLVIRELPVRSDPWAPCHPDNDGSFGSSHARLRKRGVKMKRYEVDGKGKRIGDGVEDVISPRDVAGPWSDYRVLHAKAIKERWERKQREERYEELKEQIAVAVGKLGFSGKVSAHVYERYPWKNLGKFEVGFEVTYPNVSLDGLDEVLGELKRKRAR